MSMKILVLGAAVLDITAQPIESSEKWAEKQRIESVEFLPGGDALNQCIRMADIGEEPVIVSAIGDDRNGEIIKNELISRGVDTTYLFVKSDHPTGTSLVLINPAGERHIFSVRGGAYAELNCEETAKVLKCTNEGADHILKEENKKAAYSLSERNENRSDLLSIGIKALSIASFFIEYVLEKDGGMLSLLKEASEKKIPVFADLSHDKNNLGIGGLKPFLPYIDYFMPSLSDVEKMNNVKGAEENAKIYKNLGCRNVIIKCGADGCYIQSDDYDGWCRAYSVDTVDTTGAGDCMTALFISRILNGDGIFEACKFACAGATYSTLFRGASAKKITVSDIEDFVKRKEKQRFESNQSDSITG